MATKRKMRNMGNAFAESTAGVSIESMINIAKQYGIDVSKVENKIGTKDETSLKEQLSIAIEKAKANAKNNPLTQNKEETNSMNISIDIEELRNNPEKPISKKKNKLKDDSLINEEDSKDIIKNIINPKPIINSDGTIKLTISLDPWVDHALDELEKRMPTKDKENDTKSYLINKILKDVLSKADK